VVHQIGVERVVSGDEDRQRPLPGPTGPTGLLPFQAAQLLGAAMGLVVRPLADEWAERRMLVCVRKDRPANSSLTKLLDHLTMRPA